MFLFKKIKYLILSLVAFITIGVGVGVSYWVFANEGFNNAINSDSNIDNIYENYTFGKESITDKYDIYFFPSTYYLYRFANGKDDRKVTTGPTNEPELIYGYLEPNDTGSGFVLKNSEDKSATSRTLSLNSYHIDINGLEGCFSDLDYSYWGTHLGTYLSLSANYEGYISKDDGWFGSGDIIINETSVYKSGGSGPLGSKEADDADSLQNNTSYNDLSGNMYNKFFKLEKANPDYQVLEIDDRLGYWPQLDVKEGRYLPIKLSFDSYIDYNLINSLIGDPKTDMGDSSNWFTSKFSGWISVKTSEKSSYATYLPVDGFEYKDQNNLFDFMSNLKQYAEYNETTKRYVIRLFPTFSNGKNYDEVYGDHRPSNGYRDGIRLDSFSTTSENVENAKLLMDTRFFSFKGGTNDTYSYKNTEGQDIELGLNYASINNFSYADNVKAIELRGTKVSGDGWIRVTEDGYINKDWLHFKNGSNIFGENGEIINSLSSNQLYNIYVVNCLRKSGDSYEVSYRTASTAISDIKTALYTTSENKEVLKTGNNFPIQDLQGKQLYDLGTYVIGDGSIYGVYTILYEEVADLRLVQDVSIVENSTNSYEEDINNPIDSYVTNEVNDSRGLAMNTDYIYTGTVTSNDDKNYISNLSDISSSNPYIYRIDGVDFRYSDTLSFMIVKNGKADNSAFKFNLSPLNTGVNLVSTTDKLKTDGQNELDKEEEIFENASKYISLCATSGKSSDGKTTIDYNVLRLNPINEKDNGKGYYSFIFEYNPSDMSFNVYCYRFKNIFVKIFDEKPDVYGEASGDTSGFLNHSEGEYYTYEYFAGNSINVTSDYYTPVNSNQTGTSTIGDVFKYFVKNRLDNNSETIETTSTSLDTPYKDTIDENGNSEYYLIDSVSERVIGVAKCKTDSTTKNSTIESVKFSTDLALSKNYVFYIVSKTAYQNYVLANTTK